MSRCTAVNRGLSCREKPMFKNFLLRTIALVTFMGSLTISAQVYTVANGNASFDAETPVSSYQGKSNKLKGSIDSGTKRIRFTLPVKSITTDNEKRDGHMYELLGAEKNPNVVFEGELVDSIDFSQITEQTVGAEGDFTLAGTTNKVTIPLVLKPDEKGLRMTASWSVLITDYNLERPSFLFIKVKDKHDLSINATLRKK